MSEEDIRNALVKFDREDIFYGNYEIDIDTPIEVFITIKQMSKFIKQKQEIQWYEKENKHNQEIIIKDTKEIERLNNIIGEAIEYIDWQRRNPQYDNVWRNAECEDLIEILRGDKE